MGTIWQAARAVAREQRRTLLGADHHKDVPAETLLNLALRATGLRLNLRPPGDPLLSGAHAVLDPEARMIWVRSDAAPPDRRIYIAHELAHFYLHERGVLCCCVEEDFIEPESTLSVGYGPRQRRETEANVFAREFLLPMTVARKRFAEGQDGHTVAARLGLPVSLVFAQLAESLNPVAIAAGEENTTVAETPAAETPATPPVFELDSSQELAARARTGPLLVGAGPGTGKTRTLTARVLFLTQELAVAPENLLALTFSRKAAEEMRERISKEAPDVARRACISTFHAYGLEMLRRHGKTLGLPPIPVLLEQADAIALLEKRIAQLGLNALQYLHDLAYPLPDILRMIGRVKEEMITPEAFAERAEAAGDERLRDVSRVYTVYEALLRDKGAMDYSDLICRTLRLLEENEGVRAAERAQWQHILVDEYQDINRASARLVQLLAGEGEGLWCVGDVRQSIYQFRGASPANVEQFKVDFPSGDRKDLAVNYRSRPELVSLFGVVIGEKPHTWTASRKEEQPATVTLAVADDDRAQADGIADDIQYFVREGYRYADQAILCRTRRQAQQMRAALVARGIPMASGMDEGGFLARRDIKELVILLARACEPGGPARRRFPELPDGLPYKSDAVEFFLELLWGRPRWAEKITDAAGVARLLSLARSFRDRASAVLEEDDEPRRAFLRHLRRLARLGASFGDPEADSTVDAVRLLTIHAAKGLEFPIIYVPNLSQNKFPSRPGPSLLPPLPGETAESANLEEETRLFFVAVTRARDHLILSRAQKYNNRPEWPSPLLKTLNKATNIRHVIWKPESVAMTAAEPEDYTVLPDIPMASDDAPQPAISAGKAELYLRCPRRYFYQDVAQIPTGERSPYEAFQRSVETAMESPDPSAALEAALIQHGLDELHPHTPLYRQAAMEIVRRTVAKGATRNGTRQTAAATRTLELENGIVEVRAETTDDGAIEYVTFRKPPAEGEVPEMLREPRLSLLQEIARRENLQNPPPVYLRYMQSGEAFAVPERPRVRTRHIEDYERALRGIRLKMFPPTPNDAAECPTCPYFFLCPDGVTETET